MTRILEQEEVRDGENDTGKRGVRVIIRRLGRGSSPVTRKYDDNIQQRERCALYILVMHNYLPS